MSFQIPVGEILSQQNGTLFQAEFTQLENLDLGDFSVAKDQSLPYQLLRIPFGLAVIIPEESLQIETKCDRCLKPFIHELEVKTTEGLFYEDDNEALPDEDYELINKKRMSIDLEPLVRAALILSIPDHLYCDPNCPGLSQKPAKKADKEANPFWQLKQSLESQK